MNYIAIKGRGREKGGGGGRGEHHLHVSAFLIQSAEPPSVISISALEAAQKTQWPPRDPHIRQKTP